MGYIDCNSFGTDTGKTFLQALEENDSKVDLWILDLRDNAGGYTDSMMQRSEVSLLPPMSAAATASA